jgi:hypothetical protein
MRVSAHIDRVSCVFVACVGGISLTVLYSKTAGALSPFLWDPIVKHAV